MIRQPAVGLLFNGFVVILVGLLLGFPLRYAIVRRKNQAVNAWRVGHSVIIMDGLLMLVTGLILPHLTLSELAIEVSVCSLVASGYGFVVAFTIGAWKGLRGLSPKPYGLNTVLFAAHVVGALGSFIGIVIVSYGAMKAIS